MIFGRHGVFTPRWAPAREREPHDTGAVNDGVTEWLLHLSHHYSTPSVVVETGCHVTGSDVAGVPSLEVTSSPFDWQLPTSLKMAELTLFQIDQSAISASQWNNQRPEVYTVQTSVHHPLVLMQTQPGVNKLENFINKSCGESHLLCTRIPYRGILRSLMSPCEVMYSTWVDMVGSFLLVLTHLNFITFYRCLNTPTLIFAIKGEEHRTS